jgi:ACS family tartrate transporter-like MFS transporter
MDLLEKQTMRKVGRRLIPFLMLCYFFCFLDRVNVGFAALDMNKDLGFSPSVFGFGAGILFLANMLCETPSNMVLVKVGGRRWIARIMVTWGIIACGMTLVKGETSFYMMRTLHGAAEAGFFPGVIFYLTLWFPGTTEGASGLSGGVMTARPTMRLRFTDQPSGRTVSWWRSAMTDRRPAYAKPHHRGGGHFRA